MPTLTLTSARGNAANVQLLTSLSCVCFMQRVGQFYPAFLQSLCVNPAQINDFLPCGSFRGRSSSLDRCRTWLSGSRLSRLCCRRTQSGWRLRDGGKKRRYALISFSVWTRRSAFRESAFIKLGDLQRDRDILTLYESSPKTLDPSHNADQQRLSFDPLCPVNSHIFHSFSGNPDDISVSTGWSELCTMSKLIFICKCLKGIT